MQIQQEVLKECLDDILELVEANYKEVPVLGLPFKPDVELYKSYERLGGLFIMTLRDSSKLVGYSVNVMNACPITSVQRSNCLLMYVQPDYRGFNSLRLMRRTEKTAKKFNAVLHIMAAPVRTSVDKLLARENYVELETNYAKLL